MALPLARSLPMNLAASNPPLTPPRRGTGLLLSWEGLGVRSWAPCAHKVRGILSLTVRVSGNGANYPLPYRTIRGIVELDECSGGAGGS